jgi:hypothetical protein
MVLKDWGRLCTPSASQRHASLSAATYDPRATIPRAGCRRTRLVCTRASVHQLTDALLCTSSFIIHLHFLILLFTLAHFPKNLSVDIGSDYALDETVKSL